MDETFWIQVDDMESILNVIEAGPCNVTIDGASYLVVDYDPEENALELQYVGQEITYH